MVGHGNPGVPGGARPPGGPKNGSPARIPRTARLGRHLESGAPTAYKKGGVVLVCCHLVVCAASVIDPRARVVLWFFGEKTTCRRNFWNFKQKPTFFPIFVKISRKKGAGYCLVKPEYAPNPPGKSTWPFLLYKTPY